MYRGESPAGKLASVSDDRMKEIGSVYNVKFVLDTNMYLSMASSSEDKNLMIAFKVKSFEGKKLVGQIICTPFDLASLEAVENLRDRAFIFNLRTDRKHFVNLKIKKKVFIFPKTVAKFEQLLPREGIYEQMVPSEQVMLCCTDLDVPAPFHLSVSPIKQTLLSGHAMTLELVQGIFSTLQVPDDSESLFGPMPIYSFEEESADKTCHVATHRLAHRDGTKQLTVKIIHSLPMLVSAVQIFVDDKMCFLAHLGPILQNLFITTDENINFGKILIFDKWRNFAKSGHIVKDP